MTEKPRLDIPILLPNVPDAADACVTRLIGELQDREGVERVHVAAGEPVQLCVHYDPAVVTLARIRELAQSVGARITERFGHVLWQVEGIDHERRAKRHTTQFSR